MLKALEDMHIRPIEAINLIRELLKVKSHIIPMSEEPVHLAASLGSGSSIVGEVSIDNLTELPQSLFLVPMVKAAQEAISALEQAEVILLGPGSFMTSIMPPLLLPELATALRNSNAKVIFIDNLGSFHWLIVFRKLMKSSANPSLMVSLPLIAKKVRSICLRFLPLKS